MNINNYQQRALCTCLPTSYCPEYLFSNLTAEAGEASGLYAKSIRKGLPLDITNLKKELGDVLWQVAVLADFYGLTLEEVAQANLEKLSDRKERGVLDGTGDDR